MKQLTKKDVVKMVAKKAGVTQILAEELMDALGYVMAEILKHGLKAEIPHVGLFKLVKVHGRPERVGYIDIKRKIKGAQPATEDFSKPYCKFKKSLREEIKTKTYGKPME